MASLLSSHLLNPQLGPFIARLTSANTWIRGLPTELRCIIYEYVLASDHSWGQKGIISIAFRNKSLQTYYQRFLVSENAMDFMGILSAGKALRTEASDYFYSHQFEFKHIVVLQTFLCRVPQATLSQIRQNLDRGVGHPWKRGRAGQRPHPDLHLATWTGQSADHLFS